MERNASIKWRIALVSSLMTKGYTPKQIGAMTGFDIYSVYRYQNLFLNNKEDYRWEYGY